VRDYVSDEDICRCALASLTWTPPPTGPMVVNVCTGVATTALEMVDAARSLGERPLNVRVDSSSLVVNPVMLGDPSELRRLHKSVPADRVQEFWEQLLSGRGPAR